MPFDIDKLNDRDLLMLLDGKNPSGTKWGDLVQRGPAQRPSPIPNYDPSQPVDAELLSDGDVVDRFDADPVEINAGKRNIDSGPMIHGRGSTNDPNLRGKDDVQIPSYSSKPQEDTTNYKFEPNRPSRWTDQEIASLDPENPSNPASKPKPHQSFHTEEIDKLLKDLETAQASDKAKSRGSRRAAWAQIGEEAATVGIGGLQPSATRVPMTPKHSDSSDIKDRINEYDKLLTGEEKRQNPEEERDLKDRIKKMELTAAMDRLEAQTKAKEAAAAEARAQQDKIERMKEAHSTSEGDKNRAAGIVRPIISATISSGNQGSRQDAEFANRQAERQIPGYDQIKANSATDQTEGSKLAGSNRAIQDVGHKAIEVMRKNGPNFPKSTEWQKLESTMMNLNEELTKLHQNGVMNLKDKENNDVEIGEPQKFLQYVMQNGPDVLEHALNNLKMSVDAKMYHHGYKFNPNWKAKNSSEYLPQSSGGGGTKSAPLQDPNVVQGMIDAVNSGGKMPQFNKPPALGGASGGLGMSHWDPKLRKMVDSQGRPVE